MSAITAAKSAPALHEKIPVGGGRVIEIWTATGDGSGTTCDITCEAIGTIEGVIGGFTSYTVASNVASLTWGTALSNGALQDVLIVGRER